MMANVINSTSQIADVAEELEDKRELAKEKTDLEEKEKDKQINLHSVWTANVPWNLDNMKELTLPYPNAVDFLTQPNGMETLLLSISKAPTGKLVLANTTAMLTKYSLLESMNKSRFYNLASLNDYREHFGFKRYDKIEEINDDPEITKLLKEVYNDDVNKIELYVGIWAEEKLGNSLHGTFVTAMFASTVITLLTSTPLIRKDWKTLITPLGKQIVDNFRNLGDLVELHTKLSRYDIDERIKQEDDQ